MEPTRLRSGQCPTESIWRKQIPIAEWWSWMKIPAECLPLQTCLLHRQLHLIPPRNHRQQSARLIHPAVRQRTPAPHQVQSCAASDSESSSSSEDYQPPAVSNNTYFEDTKPSSDRQKWLCTIIWPTLILLTRKKHSSMPPKWNRCWRPWNQEMTTLSVWVGQWGLCLNKVGEQASSGQNQGPWYSHLVPH